MSTQTELTVDDITAYDSIVEQSGLDRDLLTLIASKERVLPDPSFSGFVLLCPYTVNTPIGVTAKELGDAMDTNTVAFLGADMLRTAYQDMLHQASLKCHRIDPSVTPWEYNDLEILTMEQHLKKAGIPLDKCVELKG